MSRRSRYERYLYRRKRYAHILPNDLLLHLKLTMIYKTKVPRTEAEYLAELQVRFERWREQMWRDYDREMARPDRCYNKYEKAKKS